MSKLGKLLGIATLGAAAAAAYTYFKKQAEPVAEAETAAEENTEECVFDQDLQSVLDEVDEAAAEAAESADEKTNTNADILKKDLKEIFAILAGGAKEVGASVGKNVSTAYESAKGKVADFAEENHLSEKIDSVIAKFGGSNEEIDEETLKEDAEQLKEELDNELNCAAEAAEKKVEDLAEEFTEKA